MKKHFFFALTITVINISCAYSMKKTEQDFSKLKLAQTKLMHVIQEKNTDEILKILDAINQEDNAQSINTPDSQGATALHFATIYASISIIESLLKKGADINAQDKQGQTPLHWNIRIDKSGPEKSYDYNFLIIKFLLEHGANPCIQDNTKASPLQLLKKIKKQVETKEISELVLLAKECAKKFKK